MMTSYSTATLRDLLDAFASSEPLPGGGSATALTGAIAVSLLLMVAGNARTRTGAPQEKADLAEISTRLRPIREDLVRLVDADAEAYRSVIAALRLPKLTEADKASRRDAIQAATRTATDVPLQTLSACESALRDAAAVVAKGNPNASSDAAVGVHLLMAAVRGSALNVDVNVKGLQDAAWGAAISRQRQALEAAANSHFAAAERHIAASA